MDDLAHWLMIVGAFFVFVGIVGTALQNNARMVGNPASTEQDSETGEQPELLPSFLPTRKT